MNDRVRNDRHKEDRKRFGIRLKRLRREKNLTQEQLAERLGKAVEHVSFLERGERAPSFELLFDIAETLDVSPAQMLSADQPGSDKILTETVPVPPARSLCLKLHRERSNDS